MKFWIVDGAVIAIEFQHGFAALVGNRPWPTPKPHYVYAPFEYTAAELECTRQAWFARFSC